MTALIIETSSDLSFLALSQKGKVSDLIPLSSGQGLSLELHPALDRLLKEHSLSYLVVGTGPGSYAGTRTGLTVARTLSFALNIPLLGFCSPLAFFPTIPGQIGYLVDAKMGQFALFKESHFQLLHPSEIGSHLIGLDLLITREPIQGIPTTPPAPNPELVAEAAYTQFLQGHFPPLQASYFR